MPLSAGPHRVSAGPQSRAITLGLTCLLVLLISYLLLATIAASIYSARPGLIVALPCFAALIDSARTMA